MPMENKRKELVSAEEGNGIRQAVLSWLNSCPAKPMRARYDFLKDTGGLAIVTIQAAFKTKTYIYGGYMAQYQFAIAYRLIAANDDNRIAADNLLDSIGGWMEENVPDPPEGVNMWKINRDNGAAFSVPYDNGAEDHTIQMTLTYEVI